MSRGYWLFVVATLGCLTLSALLAWSLYPEQPQLSGNTAKQEQNPGYRAGGADCQPTEIDLLTGRKRDRRAVTCNEAEEQHRLQANDLVQQRRSADASDAMTVLSYQQTGIAAWGMALGFITMAAAIAAAFYARMAAVHSADAHNAFVAAERPIIRIVSAHQGIVTRGGKEVSNIVVIFKNVGRTTGKIISFGGISSKPQQRWVDVPPEQEVSVAGPRLPEAYNIMIDGWFWVDYQLLGGRVARSNFKLIIKWTDDDGYGPGNWAANVTNSGGHPDDT